MSEEKKKVVKEKVVKEQPKKPLGVQYLFIGVAGAGKSSAMKHLDDAFVVYADTKKTFPLNMVHTNVYGYGEFRKKKGGKIINNLPSKAIEYCGIDKFTNELMAKIVKYKKVKGHLPKTVAFDAITNVYKMINGYITKTTKNIYGSHSADTARDTDKFLSWIQRELVARGINVVFLAHALKVEDELSVATTGSKTFDNIGGFFGSCNYASYIHVKEGQRYIAHKDMDYSGVCRSLLPDVEEFEYADDFNMQNMIDAIKEYESKTASNEI